MDAAQDDPPIFVTTARGTLQMTIALPSDHDGPRLHKHLHTVERITVLMGEVDVISPEGRVRLSSGMGLLIPPGQAHSYSTLGLAGARLQIELDPGDEMERLYRRLITAPDRPRSELLAIAAMVDRGCDYAFDGPPLWLQRAVFWILARVQSRRISRP